MGLTLFHWSESIVDDMFYMAKLVPRVALLEEGEENNYLKVVSEHEELGELRKLFMSRVELVMEQANSEKQTYMEYSYLWTESRQEYMFYFLNFSRQLTEDEIALFEEDERSVKKVHPTSDVMPSVFFNFLMRTSSRRM